MDVVVARMRSFDPVGVAMAVASGDAAVEADGAAGLGDAPPEQPARAAATITATITGRARREAPAWVVISLSLHT